MIEDEFLVYAPNAFTPNDDNTNDVFKPVISGGFLVESYRFWITDRWGAVVFSTTDMDKAWLGDNNGDGYLVQDGVYQWQILIKQENDEDPLYKQGHVTLFR